MEDNQQKRKSREQQRRTEAGERGKLCVYHSLLSVVKVDRHKRHMSEFIICRPPFCLYYSSYFHRTCFAGVVQFIQTINSFNLFNTINFILFKNFQEGDKKKLPRLS